MFIRQKYLHLQTQGPGPEKDAASSVLEDNECFSSFREQKIDFSLNFVFQPLIANVCMIPESSLQTFRGACGLPGKE